MRTRNLLGLGLTALLISCASPPKRDQIPDSRYRYAADPGVRDYARYGIPTSGVESVPKYGQANKSPSDGRQARETAAPKPKVRDYPVAETTEKPGVVRLPFTPHAKLNVSQFQSGELARDPASGKIFRVP